MGAFEALTISSHRLCRWYLTGTEQASRRVDDLKKRIERRERFIEKSKWRIDYDEEDGVSYFNSLAGVYLRIAHERDGLRIYWNSRRGGVLYPSFTDAAAVAFDKIDSGEIRKYLDQAAQRK